MAEITKIQQPLSKLQERMTKMLEECRPNGWIDHPKEVCSRCQGFGWRRKPVALVNGVMTYTPETCDCQLEKLADNRLLKASIPLIFQQASLNLYKPQTPQQTTVIRELKKWVENYKPGTKGLGFYGKAGIGKTWLLTAVLKELIHLGYSAHFTNVPDLLNRFRRCYGDDAIEGAEDITDELNSMDILLLDDIMVSQNTEWVNQQIYTLLNHRVLNEKTTFVTFNGDIQKMNEKLTEPIASRLQGLCRLMLLDGQDRRR